MYSNLKKMYIKNFKNLGEVEVDFTESPIVALKGNNDAGKSSVIDAFAVLAYNAYETNQKGFIRLGTAGFGVKLELEDGTEITRIKRDTVNFYEVKHPDGRVWNTDRIPRGEGVPSEVEEVMGCIKESETKEFLHIRTYKDQMLFITTPNSVNYKVMYDALKVENISKAIKKGSQEANEIKAWLNNASVQRETLISAINGIKTYDIEPLVNVRERIKASMAHMEKMQKAISLYDKINKDKASLGVYTEILDANLSEISETLAIRLCSIKNMLDNIESLSMKLDKFSELDQATEIDTTVVCKIARVIEQNTVVRDKVARFDEIKCVVDLEEINTSVIDKFNSIKNVLSNIESTQQKLQVYAELSSAPEEFSLHLLDKLSRGFDLKLNSYSQIQLLENTEGSIKELTQALKDLGVKVVTCENCGHDIVVSTEEDGGVCT